MKSKFIMSLVDYSYLPQTNGSKKDSSRRGLLNPGNPIKDNNFLLNNLARLCNVFGSYAGLKSCYVMLMMQRYIFGLNNPAI